MNTAEAKKVLETALLCTHEALSVNDLKKLFNTGHDAVVPVRLAKAKASTNAAEAALEGEAQASDGAAEPQEEESEVAEGEIEIREGETLAEIKERMKREQKQKKPTIPPELLNNANSYEDKVGVVRMVVQTDHSRVAAVIRSMIEVKK